MTGKDLNTTAALNDIKAASFFDGAREGVFAFMIVAVLGVMIVLSSEISDQLKFWLLMVVFVLASVALVFVARLIGGVRRRSLEREAAMYREAQEKLRQEQILEMKAREEAARP